MPLPIPPLHGHVLLVDDEEIVRLVARRLLQRLGLVVTDVPSAEEAVALVRAEPAAYSLVLTDVSMPGMTGPQALVVLRDLAPALPVLLMSGASAQDVAARMGGVTTAEFLEKPFTLEELGAALHRVLGPPIA